MPEIDTGGLAFPLIPPVDGTGRQAVGYPYPETGMSRRDWLAGRALQGMLAHSTRYKQRHQDRDLPWHDAIAREAYELADAMIAAGREASRG